MADAVMLFAAGFGTRMRPLTDDLPKPLVRVAGRTLLDHALDLTQSIPRRVVNAHYRAEQIAEHLADRPDIALSVEAPAILDTGGGLRQALPMLGADPVITLNTDAAWTGPNPLDVLRDAWRPEIEALLLLIPPAQATGHRGKGDFQIDTSGRLSRGPGGIYSGAQILRTGTLADMPAGAFSLNRVWDAMSARGGLYGTLFPGRWCDVGRPESIALAETMLGYADV